MIGRKLFRWNVLVPALLVVACAGILFSPLIAQNQDDTAQLQQQVENLVEQLKTNDPAITESAKEALKALGPDALPFVKEALAKAENPVVGMALEEVAGVLAEEQQKREAERQRQLREQRRNNPLGGMFAGSITLVDGTGQYSRRVSPDGRIIVTAKPNGGTEETREFASEEEFKREWPEIAEKFSMFSFRVEPADPRQTRPQQPFEGPFPGNPGANDDDLQRQLDDMLRRSEDLRRMLEELQNGNPDPDEMMRRLQEMFGPQMTPEQRAERERQRLERQRRLDELQRNQPDPLQDPEGYARWLQEFMREQMRPLLPEGGNRENGQPLPFPFPRPNPNPPGQGQENAPTDPDRQQPNQEDDDEEFIAFDEMDRTAGSSPLAHVAAVGGVVVGPIDAPIRAQLVLGRREGVMVTGLRENGVLANAGVQRFDVILEVNGRPITSARDIHAALETVPTGAEFTVKLIHRLERLQLLGMK